jgi:hypothetical protein
MRYPGHGTSRNGELQRMSIPGPQSRQLPKPREMAAISNYFSGSRTEFGSTIRMQRLPGI